MRTFVISLLSTVVALSTVHAEIPSARISAANSSWVETIQRDLEAREYAPSQLLEREKGVHSTTPTWYLKNRAHRFSSLISAQGWKIVPHAPWRWSYRLRSISRGGKSSRVASPTVSESKSTVFLTYQHGVREWYKNSSVGIEQGFEIPAKPLGHGSQELVLVGDVDTDLSTATATRERIGFSHNGAEVFQYAGLKVIDATGKTLPSWLSFIDAKGTRQLNIHVDDTHAVYPVVVDPLASTPAWTAEGNQANSRFGQSVASAGDVNNDGFDDVLVGAPDFTNGQSGEGKVLLYFGSSTGLATTPDWIVESNKAQAFFGGSVSSAGDVNKDGFDDVLIGASQYTNGQTSEGRAYLYLGSASGPLSTPVWVVEGNSAAGYLGDQVANAGDINKDGFDDILVGAYQMENGQTNEGLAFVYLGAASGPSTTASAVLEANQVSSRFGDSVAGAGDVNADGFADVIVSASNFTNGETGEGRAFVYLGSATGLVTTPAWTGEPNQAFAVFGRSVASAGDVNGDGYSDILVGADNISNGQSGEGRTYLYLGSSSGPSLTPFITWESDQENASMGFRVAGAGDVDHDGYADVLTTAIVFSNGEQGEGRTFLFLGSPTGPSSIPAWTSESDQANSIHGIGLASAGDVNADGYDDVLVGTLLFSNGESQEGRAVLYLGSGEPGDLNGDKVSDVAMIGQGKIAEVVVGVTGTPTPIRVGGAALAADIATVSGNVASSLVTVSKNGSTYEWLTTSVFTLKSRTFKTTVDTGTPVVGCYVNDEYTPASFIVSGKTAKLTLYGSLADVDLTLPRGTIAARCGPAVSGASAAFSLVKGAKKSRRVVATAGGATLFTTPPLPKSLNGAGMKLGIVPRGAGEQPTVMVLAKSGRRSKLLVRDKSNKWRELAVKGVRAGSKLTDISAVRIGSTTHIVVQVTNKAKATSYKRVVVPGKFL